MSIKRKGVVLSIGFYKTNGYSYYVMFCYACACPKIMIFVRDRKIAIMISLFF